MKLSFRHDTWIILFKLRICVGNGMVFGSIGEIHVALENKIITLQSKIITRYSTVNEQYENISYTVKTTPGRMMLGEILQSTQK